MNISPYSRRADGLIDSSWSLSRSERTISRLGPSSECFWRYRPAISFAIRRNAVRCSLLGPLLWSSTISMSRLAVRPGKSARSARSSVTAFKASWVGECQNVRSSSVRYAILSEPASAERPGTDSVEDVSVIEDDEGQERQRRGGVVLRVDHDPLDHVEGPICAGHCWAEIFFPGAMRAPTIS